MPAQLTLSLDLELGEPIRVASADDLCQVHPSQIVRVSLIMSADDDEGTYRWRMENTRPSMQDLVRFLQKCQPAGTQARVWFQGRSEEFSF